MWCFHTSLIGLPVPWLVAIHRTRHALNSRDSIKNTHSLILELRFFWSLLINTTSVCPIITQGRRNGPCHAAVNCIWTQHKLTSHNFLTLHALYYSKQLAQKSLLRLCRGADWSASLFSNSVIRFNHDSAQWYVSGYHITYCRSNNINKRNTFCT